MTNNSIHPKDAAKILGITGDITPEIVKAAYRRACIKYHPDRNPAGLEMQKACNLAYEVLKDTTETINIDDSVLNYGDDLNTALNVVINMNVQIEVCGSWVWITGNTKPYKDILKDNGYKWACKKKAWYFRPSDFKSFSRGKYSLDDIRANYGSNNIRPSFSNRLSGACHG